MAEDIALHAPSFRIIETATMQPAGPGRTSYALVDREQRIVWLYRGTPQNERQAVISESLQAASAVARVPIRAV